MDEHSINSISDVRDLVLLAGIAHREGRPAEAATLFRIAMKSPHAERLLLLIERMDVTPCVDSLSSINRELKSAIEAD